MIATVISWFMPRGTYGNISRSGRPNMYNCTWTRHVGGDGRDARLAGMRGDAPPAAHNIGGTNTAPSIRASVPCIMRRWP